jgi:ribose 5-phosphate isomerase RpiB
MRIAVINEVSAADRNGDIVKALSGRGQEIINAGMKESKARPELQYIHTGLLAALLLNLQRVDFVVGGCGTGQGFLNAAMQYPGVFCGHILSPLDAWLFMQINGGNCISLALNQGYGWAGDVNLAFIFDRLFSVERGCGYPLHRREPQAASRRMLEVLSGLAHKSFAQIVGDLPEEVLRPVLEYPGVREILDLDRVEDAALRAALKKRS